MLHLMRAIDKVTGYVFTPPSNAPAPPGTIVTPEGAASTRPNAFSLFSTAAGPAHGPGSDVRDVQERWIDARVDYDAWERAQWRREGQLVQEQKARDKVRMRGGSSEGAGGTGVAMERNGTTEKPQNG